MAQGASSAPPTGSIVTSIPIRTIKGLARRCRTPAAFNGHKYTNDPPVNGDQRRASLLSLFLLLGISDAEAAPQARSKTYATIVFALSLLKGANIKAAQCTRGVRRRVHASTYVQLWRNDARARADKTRTQDTTHAHTSVARALHQEQHAWGQCAPLSALSLRRYRLQCKWSLSHVSRVQQQFLHTHRPQTWHMADMRCADMRCSPTIRCQSHEGMVAASISQS